MPHHQIETAGAVCVYQWWHVSVAWHSVLTVTCHLLYCGRNSSTIAMAIYIYTVCDDMISFPECELHSVKERSLLSIYIYSWTNCWIFHPCNSNTLLYMSQYTQCRSINSNLWPIMYLIWKRYITKSRVDKSLILLFWKVNICVHDWLCMLISLPLEESIVSFGSPVCMKIYSW